MLRYNGNGMFVSCGVKLLRKVRREVDGILCVSVECTSKVITSTVLTGSDTWPNKILIYGSL